MEKKLIVVVERPNGTTFRQQIEWIYSKEGVYDAIERYKDMLGKRYYICDWWTE